MGKSSIRKHTISEHKVKGSSSDTTPGHLEDKVDNTNLEVSNNKIQVKSGSGLEDAVTKKHTEGKLKTKVGDTVGYLDEKIDGFTLKESNNKLKIADRVEMNTMLNAFRVAINGSLSQMNMVDGVVDEFEDESGIARWDLLDEDCADISDWTDGDVDTAVSEVSPVGQFRFDTNLGADPDAYAKRSRDIGEYPDTFTVEVKVFHDAIGTRANTDYFVVSCRRLDEYFYAKFSSDGLTIVDTQSGETEVGTDLVKHGGSAEWQTWRFLIDLTGIPGVGICDVYLKDSTHDWEKVGTAIPCSYASATTDGEIWLFQMGYATDNMVTHVDYIKIATGLHFPATISENEDYDSTNDLYSPTRQETIYEENTVGNSGRSINGAPGTSEELAQSFQVSSGNIICTKISLVLRSFGTPADNTILRIETDNAGEPSGTLVDANATKTLSSASLPTGYSWFDFVFDNSFTLTQSTIYWIRLSRSGARDITNRIGLYYRWDGGDVYTDGNFEELTSSVWGNVVNADSDTTFKVYGEGDTNNMTLISNSESAEVDPDTARIVLFEEDVDSITINTDLKAYVSKDGGSTWAEVTLSDEGDYENNKRILTAIVDLTASGIGSGTNMEFKITTHNNKDLKLHGIGLLWD